MPASDPYPYGVDPAHVWDIAAAAVPGRRRGTAVLVGGRYAARVHLPSRPAAHAVHAALRRVGYQVGQPAGGDRGRDLIVAGWSAEALESRLAAMRTVMQKLSAEPGATAVTALDQLAGYPAAALLSGDGQQRLVGQARERLRAWIWDTSGIHAPCERRAQPADPRCALRLAATRRAEEAIDHLALRHLQVSEAAIALYPALRQHLPHDKARDIAIRRASPAFHLSSPIGQDLSPLLRSADSATRPAASPPASPSATSLPTASAPTAPRQTGPPAGPRPGWRAAREFPGADVPVSRPPSIKGSTRPRGRNFSSGRPGRRR